jgi:serine phosphatase RsbU (regulator of sigma subunit)
MVWVQESAPLAAGRSALEVALSNRDGAETDPDAEHAGVLARLHTVEEAAERIGTTLDEQTTCAELARFLCRHLCDAAAVDLLTDQGTGARPPSPEALTRVATAGLVKVLEAQFPDGGRAEDAPSARALDGEHPVTVAAVLPGGRAVQAVVAPLLAYGHRYGVLLALRAGGGFCAQETATVHHLARLTATRLAHARRHAAVQRTAMDLQRALLAEPGRPHPNLELATRYLPSGSSALVGGDWFETVRLHYGRTLLVMGDVMGHGLDAAVDMNAYRSHLRYVAATDLPPHRVLRQLDAAVAEEESRRPATCLLARVDPARGIAAFASAGHLPPAVIGPGGTAGLVDVPVGPPLGTGVGGYELVTRALTPAETLLMFTDGLIERRGEDIDASLSRLARMRLPAGAGVEQMLDEVLLRLDGLHAEDDVALLAARIRHHPGGEAAGPVKS